MLIVLHLNLFISLHQEDLKNLFCHPGLGYVVRLGQVRSTGAKEVFKIFLVQRYKETEVQNNEHSRLK